MRSHDTQNRVTGILTYCGPKWPGLARIARPKLERCACRNKAVSPSGSVLYKKGSLADGQGNLSSVGRADRVVFDNLTVASPVNARSAPLSQRMQEIQIAAVILWMRTCPSKSPKIRRIDQRDRLILLKLRRASRLLKRAKRISFRRRTVPEIQSTSFRRRVEHGAIKKFCC